jgi:hypothetical protein
VRNYSHIGQILLVLFKCNHFGGLLALLVFSQIEILSRLIVFIGYMHDI